MKFLLTISLTISVILTAFTACQQKQPETISNPIMDGYYADPSIVIHEGVYYIYATKDPWGGEDLALFSTTDFKEFTSHTLNWPTKEACTSPTSREAMVWAPSVIKGLDGRFYMYISVGSEIWAGESDSPTGPWRNIKEDQSPLIHGDLFPDYHMIDAEAFIDEDGQAYLYWGSGWNWVNGACFVAKLAPDMHSFMEEPVNVTPPGFFEAAFMLKKDGTYYLMYSDGKAIEDSYKVRYSSGDTPYGPWEEGENSPILTTNEEENVEGPGHHTVFEKDGQHYILYHKIFPQDKDYVLRQLCVDSLNFDAAGHIEKIDFNGIVWE
ncbi:family 43 glycosylhydrolase [Geofilum rubicundum]|uniref:Glycoside hydrolase n=1 Tax=Geofilum rubicundum JCM 15548 TaxID=1236989 RepID=A0A0E9LTK1_9BACT|nr:family 43 glycosylhydrolase [Geofilum rubicundum]GAO28456.1 glycoside hydrolase [Geofilum rubicundum JCM 15548]